MPMLQQLQLIQNYATPAPGHIAKFADSKLMQVAQQWHADYLHSSDLFQMSSHASTFMTENDINRDTRSALTFSSGCLLHGAQMINCIGARAGLQCMPHMAISSKFLSCAESPLAVTTKWCETARWHPYKWLAVLKNSHHQIKWLLNYIKVVKGTFSAV